MVSIKLSRDEIAALKLSARSNGQTVSAWIRARALAEAAGISEAIAEASLRQAAPAVAEASLRQAAPAAATLPGFPRNGHPRTGGNLMRDFIEWQRRRLQAGPCEPFDADLHAAMLECFIPVWIASNPPDPGDVRAFLAAHRRQAADDPSLLTARAA